MSLSSAHNRLSEQRPLQILQHTPSERRAELMICSPHQPVRVISARLSGLVNALQILWPEKPKRFIYNGMQLLESKTFSYYGISDGDSIIALPKEDFENEFKTTQWLNLTRDNESFNESMKWMLHPHTANEAARLRDIHLIKMEDKPKVYMKMKMPFENGKSDSCPICTNQLNIVDTPEAPSEEALPVLW